MLLLFANRVEACKLEAISHFVKLEKFVSKNGATARIRTWDPNIRSVVFYPAELRLHR